MVLDKVSGVIPKGKRGCSQCREEFGVEPFVDVQFNLSRNMK